MIYGVWNYKKVFCIFVIHGAVYNARFNVQLQFKCSVRHE